MFIATCTSTIQVTVPLSAYPLAFPGALATDAILPPDSIRLATYSGNRPIPESISGSYFVPNFPFDASFRILSLHARLLWVPVGLPLISQPPILSLFGTSLTAFWLVLHNDDSIKRFVWLSMTSYVRRDSALGAFVTAMIPRFTSTKNHLAEIGDLLSLLHLEGWNYTITKNWVVKVQLRFLPSISLACHP